MIQDINYNRRDLDFVAPYIPKICARQLKSLSNNYPFMTQRTRVKIKRFKSGNYHFRITRSVYQLPTYRHFRGYSRIQVGRSNYVKLHMSGYLVRWADKSSTIVIGQGDIDPKTYVVNGGFFLLFALALLILAITLLADFFFCAPLLVIMLISFAHTTAFQPETLGEKHINNLVREIRHALNPPNA